MPTHLVKEALYADIKKQLPEVVVQPWGATEPHNLHLPYGTDIFQCDAIADCAAAAANSQGASVAVLPCIPYGVQTNQLPEFPLAINLNPTTQFAILKDVVESLAVAGIRKLVILNGHGGNDFYWMTRELYRKQDLFIVVVNWFEVYDRYSDHVATNREGEHAHEMETNFMLHLHPQLVRMDLADDGATARARLSAMREGWARATRTWQRFTKNSGAGDPSQATAEKGAKSLQIVVEKLTEFLVELSAAERDERFPFE